MAEQSDTVFLMEGDELHPLPARPWRAGLRGETLEAALQSLIEEHPEVLPGRQMDPTSDDPPRFALLRREMTVTRWGLDLLLVDHRGVLTLVETKLTENPEARREVIGQILEYAANAANAWGGGRAREQAREYWSRKGRDVDAVVVATFGPDFDVEEFWRTIEENLRYGKIRLIVAADALRPEVRRIIEYLNAEMSTAEVYGLELRRHGDESGPVFLTSQLVGQTQATAEHKAGVDSTLVWTADRLRSAYATLGMDRIGECLRRVLDWAVEKGYFMEARGKGPIFGLRGRGGSRIITFAPDWTFCYLNETPYPGGVEERDQLVADLRTVGMYQRDFDPREVVSGRNLSRSLTDLSEPEFETFLRILSRVCETPQQT